MRWRRRRQIVTTTSEEMRLDGSLVREAELFLCGNYLEISFVVDREVPVWVWLSTLAHGNEATLLRATHWVIDNGELRPELDTWGRVLQHIAQQVLDTMAIVGCSLSEIQRDLLVPLELAIITTPVGPATLYRLIDSMLLELQSRSSTR